MPFNLQLTQNLPINIAYAAIYPLILLGKVVDALARRALQASLILLQQAAALNQWLLKLALKAARLLIVNLVKTLDFILNQINSALTLAIYTVAFGLKQVIGKPLAMLIGATATFATFFAFFEGFAITIAFGLNFVASPVVFFPAFLLSYSLAAPLSDLNMDIFYKRFELDNFRDTTPEIRGLMNRRSKILQTGMDKAGEALQFAAGLGISVFNVAAKPFKILANRLYAFTPAGRIAAEAARIARAEADRAIEVRAQALQMGTNFALDYYDARRIAALENATDQAIAGDFTSLWQFIQDGGYSIHWLTSAVNVNNNKHSVNNFWHPGVPRTHTTPQMECNLTVDIMSIPVYLPTYDADGALAERYYVDLSTAFTLLRNDPRHPLTRAGISLESFIYDADLHADIRAAHAGVVNAPANAQQGAQAFDAALDQALAAKDLTGFFAYLKRKGGTTPGRLVNWTPALTAELAASKYLAPNFWDDKVAPEIRVQVQGNNPDLCCQVKDDLLHVPVTIGTSRCDLLALLQHMQTRQLRDWEGETNLATGGPLRSLPEIHLDTRTQTAITDAIAWQQAVNANDFSRFLAHLQATHRKVENVTQAPVHEYLAQHYGMLTAEQRRTVEKFFDLAWFPALEDALTKIKANNDQFLLPGITPATVKALEHINGQRNKELCCPICLKIMRNPVRISDGNGGYLRDAQGAEIYYEALALFEWFAKTKGVKDPITGTELTSLNQIVYASDKRNAIAQTLRAAVTNPAAMTPLRETTSTMTTTTNRAFAGARDAFLRRVTGNTTPQAATGSSSPPPSP